MEEKLRKSKEVYDKIPIPNRLHFVVESAILKHESSKKSIFYRKRKPYLKPCACMLVIFCLLFVGMVNGSPAVKGRLLEIPVLSGLAEAVTFTKGNNLEQEILDSKNITVDMPLLKEGDTKTEKRICAEISDRLLAIIKSADAKAGEYRKAYVAAGGKRDQFQPIAVDIRYEIKHSTENMLSFMVIKSETMATYYEELHCYTIDLRSGKELTLEQLLGKDYESIAYDTIRKEIKKREEENPEEEYFSEDMWEFTADDMKFYLNEEGKVVLIFEKYELAPGYMGNQEFVVENN